MLEISEKLLKGCCRYCTITLMHDADTHTHTSLHLSLIDAGLQVPLQYRSFLLIGKEIPNIDFITASYVLGELATQEDRLYVLHSIAHVFRLGIAHSPLPLLLLCRSESLYARCTRA
jgi:hypothetical protein